MPPPWLSFWVAATSSALLLAWFVLFLFDGLQDDFQRTAAVLIGVSGAVAGGHAGAIWKDSRVSKS
jgi:hypothetical protein